MSCAVFFRASEVVYDDAADVAVIHGEKTQEQSSSHSVTILILFQCFFLLLIIINLSPTLNFGVDEKGGVCEF